MKSPVTAIGVVMLLGGNIVRATPRNILKGEQIQHLDDAAIGGLVENRPEMKEDPRLFHAVVAAKSLEHPPLEPVVPNKRDSSDDDSCVDDTDPVVEASTKAPSPSSNGGERPEAIASDHARGTAEEEDACEEGDAATPNGTASNTLATNTAVDIPAKASGSGTTGKVSTPGEEYEDVCEEDVAAPGGATGSYTPAKDTTTDAPAKVPDSGTGSSYDTPTKGTTADVPGKAPRTDTGAGAPGHSKEEVAIVTSNSATGSFTPAKDSMDSPGKPPNSGTSGTMNNSTKDTTSADAPAEAPSAGSGASRDIPTKETIPTDAPGQASESSCQACVCDDMCVNGSNSETKTHTPNGQEPEPCKQQRTIMDSCDAVDPSCFCNENPFFDMAIACARECCERILDTFLFAIQV